MLMLMSRLALELLDPLPLDLQIKIFRSLYPTLKQATDKVEGLCTDTNDLKDLSLKLIEFLHSDDSTVSFRLSAEDTDYIEHCCDGLHLRFEGKEQRQIMKHPEHSWPEYITVVKPSYWTFFWVPPAGCYEGPMPRCKNITKNKERICDHCKNTTFWVFHESQECPENLICYECQQELVQDELVQAMHEGYEIDWDYDSSGPAETSSDDTDGDGEKLLISMVISLCCLQFHQRCLPILFDVCIKAPQAVPHTTLL